MSIPVPAVVDLSVPRPSIASKTIPPSKPIAIFSDFDGTIFLQDTGHILFDQFGCGQARRHELDTSIGKTRTFREASEEMWGSLDVDLDTGLAQLGKELTLDRDFVPFLEFCTRHGIPFAVISAGLRPLLRGALDKFLGPEESAKIRIVSNDAEISTDGQHWTWKPIWRHDSPLGHDKAQSIDEFRESVKGQQEEEPLVLFIGDGVSDLAAASKADLLFARRGLALEEYCIEHQIPYIPYDSFADIKVDLENMVRGNKIHDPEGLIPTSESGPGPAKPVTSSGPIPDTPKYEHRQYFESRPAVTRLDSVGMIPEAKEL